MKNKLVLLIMLLFLASVPAFAAKYSSDGEAAFVGALQGAFIAIVIWAYSVYKKRKKNKKDEE